MDENLRNNLGELFPELVFFDDPVKDSSIVGLGLLNDNGPAWCVVYDENLVINDLLSEFGDEQDAIDWYSYNTAGTYCGETTPIFIHENDYNDFPASRIGREFLSFYRLHDIKDYEQALHLVSNENFFVFVGLNQLDEIRDIV
jgi:hypothetical protein